MDTLIQKTKNVFYNGIITVINEYRGDLTDISAKKASLIITTYLPASDSDFFLPFFNTFILEYFNPKHNFMLNKDKQYPVGPLNHTE